MSTTKPTDQIVIGHGNVYAGNRDRVKAVAMIRKQWADSFGVNEGYKVHPLLQHMLNNHELVGEPHRTKADPGLNGRIPAHDVPLLVRKKHKIVGHHTHKVSDTVEPKRVGIERWINVGMYHHPVAHEMGFEGIAHIVVHPVAGPDQLVADHSGPLAKAYWDNTKAVDAMLTQVKAANFLPILTGDVQVPERAPQRPWSIYPVLADHGLLVWNEHLDTIAYPKRLALVHQKVIPAGPITGADHPWLVGTFKDKRAV